MDSDFRPPQRPESVGTPKPDPKDFQTPLEAAAADDLLGTEQVAAADLETEPTAAKPKSSLLNRLKHKWHLSERQWLVSIAIVLVCGSTVALIVKRITAKPVASATEKVQVSKIPVEPKIVTSSLSGLPVDPALNKRPVTGVMIENTPFARPQSGLSEAGVVFEAIAEAGITRFLALYQEGAPGSLGPVRSARPYYVQWSMGFDAPYAHVGGSPDALAFIKANGVKDLDQFHNAGAYHRIKSRSAPHNMYTSMSALHQAGAGKGYNSSQFSGFVRKKAAPAKQPTTTKIDLKLSGPVYNVHYDYVPASNSYHRSEGGAPHIDANTNAILNPAVVIALITPYGLEADGYHSRYSVVGTGQALIFQDGTVTSTTWAKTTDKDQIKFTDAAGKPFKLNPGQTWITAVKSPGEVIYTP